MAGAACSAKVVSSFGSAARSPTFSVFHSWCLRPLGVTATPVGDQATLTGAFLTAVSPVTSEQASPPLLGHLRANLNSRQRGSDRALKLRVESARKCAWVGVNDDVRLHIASFDQYATIQRVARHGGNADESAVDQRRRGEVPSDQAAPYPSAAAGPSLDS